ncbi:amino acid adenylation domain-containing protein [Streptomyces sp. NPDC059063]|uniref:non-ribosomal peptide synthetase n=1 Tax=unclassified Streptomyces TaxID=2593676 RepID=UPI0036C2EDC7
MTRTPTGHRALSAVVRHFTRVPDRTAIVVGPRALTYRELDEASAALAARLTAAGVRPGRTAVLYQRQTVEVVVGMVAAARIGAAWCVVNPGHPVELLRALLDDVDCGAVVFDPADPATSADAVAALGARARGAAPVLLEQGGPRPAGPPADDVVSVPGNAPAYVITTSGSTGVPKAVVITVDNLAALLEFWDYPYDESHLVAFSAMRLTWDGSLHFTLRPLILGGTAVLPGEDELSDADAAARLARTWRATHLAATPSFYRLMLPGMASFGAHLRLVVLGGEALPVPLAERHREVLPGVDLRNVYGPTETTVISLAHPVREAAGSVVPIGRPFGACTAYVLDERLMPVVPGRVGELYIGGPHVAAGYAARPAQTAERFVADLFTGQPGERMYRTGDLALVNSDGEVEFRGRADGQMKVRGARIERRAVESVLESHPAVSQAVVLGVPSEHGETTLAAFWAPAEAAAVLPGTRELLTYCAERLVAQAVPERLIALGAFPLAPSGKVDEAALRALLTDPLAGAAAEGRQRWTPVQRSLAEIWAAVLQHDDFGLDDVFFQVGGNSRRVVELHVRMEGVWPGVLRVGQLFDLRTVAEQAEALEAGRATRAEQQGRPRPDDDVADSPGTGTDGPVLFEI